MSVGLFHHVLVYMGYLQLVHPALNLSTLDAGIYGGLPQVGGTILRKFYSLGLVVCLKVYGWWWWWPTAF